jgi:membrane-associated phospholipid phosphatase
MFSSKEIKYYFFCLAAILPFLFIDQYVIIWIREFKNANPDLAQFLQYFDKAAYYGGHGTPLITGGALLYLAGRYFGREKIMELGKKLFIGLICSGAAGQIIKHLAGRARPRITDQLLFIGPSIKGSYDSLPSGHASLAFCLAYLVSACFPRFRVPLYIYAVLVCIGRVDSASHFPADVLLGALLGIITARIIEKKVGKRDAATPGG